MQMLLYRKEGVPEWIDLYENDANMSVFAFVIHLFSRRLKESSSHLTFEGALCPVSNSLSLLV